jgi:hypothetical protein
VEPAARHHAIHVDHGGRPTPCLQEFSNGGARCGECRRGKISYGKRCGKRTVAMKANPV